MRANVVSTWALDGCVLGPRASVAPWSSGGGGEGNRGCKRNRDGLCHDGTISEGVHVGPACFSRVSTKVFFEIHADRLAEVDGGCGSVSADPGMG